MRYVSTAYGLAHWHHTLGQYRSWSGTIRYAITERISLHSPCAECVEEEWPSTMRYVSTGHHIARAKSIPDTT
eukprot:3912213-Rhodomonas_salina.1